MGRAWQRGWRLLLAAPGAGAHLSTRRRWAAKALALWDLPRLRIFRIGVLLLLAGILLARSLVWHLDLRGGARDALLVLPVLVWAPWLARLYRRGLISRLRGRMSGFAGTAHRCSNSRDETPDATDCSSAAACRRGVIRRRHRGALVRRSERLSR